MITETKSKFNKKILCLIFVFLAFFVMLINSPVYASTATTSTFKPTWDTSIYDTTWTKAKVKYWTHYWNVGWINKTTSYIRITDINDNFIEDITRLEATYVIDDKYYTVNRKSLSEDRSTFKFGNIFSKDGQLQPISEKQNKEAHELSEKYPEEFKDYKDCNYLWSWSYKVTDIVYLYVWYLDPTTGKEVAASFAPNGEHPVYNDAGVLTGIYNVEGDLLENYTLNDRGIPSMMLESGVLEPVIKSEDQEVGSLDEGSVFDKIGNYFSGIKDDVDKGINTAKTIIYCILGLIAVGVGAFVILKARKWWKDGND